MQQATYVVGMAIVVAFGFYAMKLLASFREGMLEKGWKQVAVGAILLILSQFLFLVSGIGFSNVESVFNTFGTLTRFFGMVFIILGMRAHYQVWRLDNKELEVTTESGKPLEC
ncbi:MAG: hypothetical protein JRN52_15680 [Nitrososphaerota archaeon]|nr:hypothetical protein [Nitrososphaerota archaeon]